MYIKLNDKKLIHFSNLIVLSAVVLLSSLGMMGSIISFLKGLKLITNIPNTPSN